MAKPIPNHELSAIEEAIRQHPGGASLEQIERSLRVTMPRRTLQHRLKHLVSRQRIGMTGGRRWARYSLNAATEERTIAGEVSVEGQASLLVPVSKLGKKIHVLVRRPLAARKPVGYHRHFLDAYRPNVTTYLSANERERLHVIGTPKAGQQPAGTYARQILNRLLIDLAWNSSRLEGNTYSLLDTKRLIDLGQRAEGKDQSETQMILNHKDAIEFLVSEADEIGFNRYTILNLHGILANNLLADPNAPGRLRHIAVAITGSVFHPLEVPQLIEECFDQILATAAAIRDPFEQALFVMVQLPYLQPFDDVNKRVSRLAANIPLIRGNLSPLSFTDVPQELYNEAMLGIYELNEVELLKDIFIWGYERSAARYASARQSLGEPDPFRLRHRDGLRTVVREIVRAHMGKKAASAHLANWIGHLAVEDRSRFREIVESELLSLHEGNFARYQIRPSEFAEWQNAWKTEP